MKHFLMQPTWRCQNCCRYCWTNNSIRARPEMLTAKERSAFDWAKAIERDGIELIDIAGGEPLLLPWVPTLIKEMTGTMFGLSTNGLDLRAIRKLVSLKPVNLIAINVSYHPDTCARVADYNTRFQDAVRTLHDAGMHVHCNVVDHGDNQGRAAAMIAWLHIENILYEVSPYEEVLGLGDKLPQGLCCQGGINHLTVAPDGSAWPCLTTLRSPYWRETCLGNWLDGTVDIGKREQPCYLNCADYFILKEQHNSGDMWGTQAQPCE